jgi:hypothetical protein
MQLVTFSTFGRTKLFKYMNKSPVHDNSFFSRNKTTYFNSLLSWIAVLELWSSTSMLLAHNRSFIFLSCTVVDIGIYYVTSLSWQFEITIVVFFGIDMVMIFLQIIDFNSTFLRIWHLSVTSCHVQDKYFSLGVFPFLISRFIHLISLYVHVPAHTVLAIDGAEWH